MRARFVQTTNTARFLAALGRLQERGAEEACLMVVDGPPGTGKSECVEWCATQRNWVFLRAKKEWRPSWMLRDLLEALQQPHQHSFEKMYKSALEVLGRRALAAEREDEVFAIVIDEADHIVRKETMMETLRDLSDYLEIPVILVGMGRISSSLGRYPQISSRVGQYVEFLPFGPDDTAEVIAGLSEVSVAQDMIEYVHAEAKGMAREIKEAIQKIEAFGRRNQGPVTVEGMAGQVLMYDRASGAPIMVKVR